MFPRAGHRGVGSSGAQAVFRDVSADSAATRAAAGRQLLSHPPAAPAAAHCVCMTLWRLQQTLRPSSALASAVATTEQGLQSAHVMERELLLRCMEGAQTQACSTVQLALGRAGSAPWAGNTGDAAHAPLAGTVACSRGSVRWASKQWLSEMGGASKQRLSEIGF